MEVLHVHRRRCAGHVCLGYKSEARRCAACRPRGVCMYGGGHGLGLCCAIEPESIKADLPTRAVLPTDADPELIEGEGSGGTRNCLSVAVLLPALKLSHSPLPSENDSRQAADVFRASSQSDRGREPGETDRSIEVVLSPLPRRIFCARTIRFSRSPTVRPRIRAAGQNCRERTSLARIPQDTSLRCRTLRASRSARGQAGALQRRSLPLSRGSSA